MTLGVVATVVSIGSAATNMYGSYKAGKDQEKAYEQQSQISAAQAQHNREVAYRNAGVLRDYAARLRGEQVSRLNEYLQIGTERLGQQHEQTLQRGVEEENKVRRNVTETISSQRAATGAAGILIDYGTPANLQIDTARLGEVDALRVRKNHRLEGEKILQQMDDLRRDTAYQVADLNFDADAYDRRAELTMLEGDMELSAGLNRSDAYKQAGAAARSAGVYNIIGAGLSGAGQTISLVDPKWFSK